VRPRKVERARQLRHPLKRLAVALFLAALTLAASASPAGASVTIGQTQQPLNANFCGAGFDWVQPTVTSGNPYVVPASVATGTINSWSSHANLFGGTLTMKVFRKVADPARYIAVGHDGPHAQNLGVLNTFAGISIPVKAGDVLGLHAGTGNPGCLLIVPGDSAYNHFADLADGQSGDFQPAVNNRLNVTAVVNPSNAFTLGAITRSKRKGTATLTVTVPNPGELSGSGKGVRVAGAAGAVISKTVSAPGKVKLTIKAKGTKKRKLNETGKVKVKPTITYTPTGGDPSSQSAKVKLKKNL
jgi:hypothetical protein